MGRLIELLKNIIELLYSVTNDYGIAIVLITVIMRLLLVPLDVKQRKQMEKQKEMGEEVEAIRRKYRNDKKKMDAEISRYYQEKGTAFSGCLMAVLPFPVMIGLYNAIRLISDTTCATVLLPWVSSLLVRDQFLILPILTIIVQILPQMYPYLEMFESLELNRQSQKTILVMLLMSCMYIFVIPSGVGLYCFVSSAFQAIEQFILNVISVRKMNRLA